MANQLVKPFKHYPIGQPVKVHSIEAGLADVSFPPATKHYLIGASSIGKKQQQLGVKFPANTTVSPARPILHPHDWSKLDAVPQATAPTLPKSIRVQCYCGKSEHYYDLQDMRTQQLEFIAVNKAIADCSICSIKDHKPMSQQEPA